MTEEMEKPLRDKGLGELVNQIKLIESGNAAVNKSGIIVDTRKNPNAVKMPKAINK